jgi:flavin reductase (DIM6/NTAB) family NADH-FMN oxidoreductase RutF
VVFIRPQRYTYEFTENTDKISLSFFDDSYKEALSFCGKHSGRDCDKFSATGLSVSIDTDTPIIDQARIVLECKKLYADDLKKDNFIFDEPLSNYKNNDFHRFYICEIEKALIKK